MKKRLALLFSLVMVMVLLCGCEGKMKLIKYNYGNGIANFYQYFITGYYDGLDVQSTRVNYGDNRTENLETIDIIESNNNEATALLMGKEYIMASIDTFISATSSKVYIFNIGDSSKTFEVKKIRDTSLPIVSTKPFSEYEITSGYQILDKVYVRLDTDRYDVAVPVTEGQNVQYYLYTITYNNGHLTMSVTINTKTYSTEIMFDNSGAMYVILDVSNEIHYEMILGSQAVKSKYSLSVAKGVNKIEYDKLADRMAIDNFATENRYPNTLCSFHTYDGITFKSNKEVFNEAIEEDQAISLNYRANVQKIETLKA